MSFYPKPIHEAPASVQYLLMKKNFGQGVGWDLYVKTVKENPDWFPDEFKELKQGGYI